MKIIQFILFGIVGLLIVFFLAAGAIGYLFYSSNNPPPSPPPTIPNWQELIEVPREVLISGAIVLGAIWVLVGGVPTKKEDGKSEPKKGRKRRHLDKD